ncbi:MAG: D-alanyl-D-alanine carboxypeptidase family protein [Verrucomicrobiales bacterium]
MALTRRKFSFSLAAGLFGASGSFLPAAQPPPKGVFAKSWIVVDAVAGTVLGGLNADLRREVASTQKLMTGLLICERGGLRESITVQRSDTLVAPSRLGIKAGDKYPRVELLKALLLKSGNDLAHCLGREHSGSEANFAIRMTEMAKKLGMASSVFKNASGLPDSTQYSTARDMARLALRIHRHPDPAVRGVLLGITRMATGSFRFADGRTLQMTNTNKLLTRVPGCNGMKTGYTNAAGRCLVSSVARDGRLVIVVALGSDSKNIWNDSQLLLEWGLRRG